MSLAVCLTNDFKWDNRIPFSVLKKRWKEDEVNIFIEKIQNFVHDSNYKDFLKAQEELHNKVESSAQNLIQNHFHLEWFDKMFGPRSSTDFTIIVSLLNGNAFYGASTRINDQEKFYCFLSAWNENLDGHLSSFYMGYIAHEFCHLYVNPLVYSHASQFEKSGKCIFAIVEEKMEKLAYGNWKTMIAESIVRALESHYRKDTGNLFWMSFEMMRSKSSGFLWLPELHDLLNNYNENRDLYPTFDLFIPTLVEFFDTYSDSLEKQ
jgi:hypothetical protein